jgi:hypothetical protein
MTFSSKPMALLFGVSLTFFALSATLLGVLIWKADKLTAYGLTGNLYFVVLVPLGLSAAALLFGVLHSTALWKGTALGGTLELGGPIVLLCLIELGGFYLVQNALTFPLTVYVHGEHGPQDLPLRKSGQVVLRLGLEPRSEPIGTDGECFFPAIPASFRNQAVPVWVESDEFESGGDTKKLTIPSIDLTVRRKGGKVSGRIEEDQSTFVPIPGAELRIAGLTVTAGPGGEFEITIPGDHMQSQLDIDITAPGFAPIHTTVVPNSNPAVIKLVHKP